MQIKGEEFIKKVQLQQEREELERKLNELEEVEMSIEDEPVILSRSINNNINNTDNDMEINDHELNNIMLGSSNNSNEENKKKYLILGIVLVVLFLLTIIIIRLLSGETKEDQFTSNNAESGELRKLSENSNIEENFQKIINERVKKDSTAPMVPEIAKTTDDKLENMQQAIENNIEDNETIQQEEAPATITNEALDETIKKIEEKKSIQKEKVVAKVEKKEPVKREVTQRKTEEKKSVKKTVESPSSDMSKGYFVQIGAFTKKPSDSYINTIRNEKFKYKIYQTDIKGTTYNKVLIGPYSSRTAASQDVDAIKEKLNVSNAFIVKF